jgi:hypothetical protein
VLFCLQLYYYFTLLLAFVYHFIPALVEYQP